MTAALDTEFARWQAQVFEIDLLDLRCTGRAHWHGLAAWRDWKRCYQR
jgi:hypothetical protein